MLSSKYRGSRLNRTILAVSISGMVWNLAQAQSTAPSQSDATMQQVPEVVVTAQRARSLESATPVAMTVLSGEQLQRAGFDSPATIGERLPNVHLDGAADGLKITIRGISNEDTTDKGDPSAAFMLDGIYLARPQNQNLSFYDLDRIEVLRGPQGTLYGRNTTAGAINVISNTPQQRFEGALGAAVGNHASRQGNAMLNVPVGDALALRAALAYNKHDSYLTNGQGTPYALGLDRDDRSARLSAKLAIGKDATLLLRYDHSTVNDSDDSAVPDTNFYKSDANGSPVWYDASTSERLTNRFMPPNTRLEQGYSHKTTSGLGAELAWNLGAATLYYVGAHRNFDHDMLVNYYYRLAPGFAIGVHEDFSGDYAQDSHELRVATNGNGPVTAQAGLYYFREESNLLYAFRDLELIGLPPHYVFPTNPTTAHSKAAFGQATWRVRDALRLTAGVRYTDDDKSRIGSTNFQQAAAFNPATDIKLLNAATLENHKLTWRLGADYDLAPGTMAYGSVATGYKAGGFNDGCLAGTRALGIDCPAAVAVPAATLFYQPETLTAYEIGLKSRFWENKASVNLAAFDYDYKNLQLSNVAIVQGAPRYVTANAGVAAIRGLELDGLVTPTPFDRISYALTLLDAHYVSYSPDGVHSWSGRKLDRSPRNTVTLGYEHRFRLGASDLTGGAVARRSSAYVISVPTQLLQYPVPAHTATDLTLGWQPDGAQWRLQAQVRNLENKVQPLTIDSFGKLVPSDPRTVDLRMDYRF
jgi:iron complex outermembrane receptor protein